MGNSKGEVKEMPEALSAAIRVYCCSSRFHVNAGATPFDQWWGGVQLSVDYRRPSDSCPESV